MNSIQKVCFSNPIFTREAIDARTEFNFSLLKIFKMKK